MKKIIVVVITLCMITGCSSLKPDGIVKNNTADNTHAGSAADNNNETNADNLAAPSDDREEGSLYGRIKNAVILLVSVALVYTVFKILYKICYKGGK
jgi:hypothetical protein